MKQNKPGGVSNGTTVDLLTEPIQTHTPACEPSNNEGVVKPDMENIAGNENHPFNSNSEEIFNNINSNFNEDPKNNFIHAVGLEESIVELVTRIAIAEFENKEDLPLDSNIEETLKDNGSNFNEDRKNELFHALADHVGQNESDNELSATNVVVEFQNKNKTCCDAVVMSDNTLICFDVKEILNKDQVGDDIFDSNATEDDAEDSKAVIDESF